MTWAAGKLFLFAGLNCRKLRVSFLMGGSNRVSAGNFKGN